MTTEKSTLTANLESYQMNGTSNSKRYSKIEYVFLNDYQNFLYNRAMFGLSVYNTEEIKEMHWEKKKRIVKVHRRTQKTLNLWKQSITNNICNNFFKHFFPNTRFIDVTYQDTSEEFVNKTSFKSLGINKIEIINKLITEGLLPVNFYQLKTP